LPTAEAPPLTSPSIFKAKRPSSFAGTKSLTTVIEPRQRGVESTEAVRSFSVRCHVISWLSSTWKKSG
jgi:hypothetical protein